MSDSVQKKRICVLSATRAEYGLLKPVIQKLMADPVFDVAVAVTGMHLSPKFGMTYKEIENDGIPIDTKIEILQDSDTPTAVSTAMGTAIIRFAEYFADKTPDMLVVLGDRYETLAVCCAATNQRIPIAHLYGGETTEGAVDEAYRHAITKMSYLHFTSTEEYRKRVIQLGEEPSRVFNVGALGVENIKSMNLLSREELERTINWRLDKPYAVVTFHPVTLEQNSAGEQFQNLLDVCSAHGELKYIFTKANADADGAVINRMIDEYASSHENAAAFASLGSLKYLSALKHCTFAAGNSSSGIVEAPSFGIPTVNIGDRQKGRIQAESIINCPPAYEGISAAFELALAYSHQENKILTANPYDGAKSSEKIVAVIKERLISGEINLKKKFWDVTYA
ncbi:MAG: UDP-N-acetylglucosamine 2-epimerase [Synergistaceae bacterium]|nr:UDP-N-acetylglucosamine 2-epimerase [Synergistaceae bacterium]